MPEKIPLQAVHLRGVLSAQQAAAAERAAEENGREIAAKKTPAPTGPVRGVDPPRPAGGPKGARAIDVPRRKRAKKKDVEKAPTPPDPAGRGSSIDVRA